MNKNQINIRQKLNSSKEWWILLLILITTFLIYKPGLSGPFVFDDLVNILDNNSLKINKLSWDDLRRTLNSVQNGIFGRPLSMFTFAIDYYWDRNLVSPFPVANTFKTTNLIIHLVNGVVVFILSKSLISVSIVLYGDSKSRVDPKWIALAVSAAWLLHPFNLTPVLYVVQRMTSLSTLFILIGMTAYVFGRKRLANNQAYARISMLLAMFVFTPLAFLFKEIGIMLPAYIALIELIIFQRRDLSTKSKQFLVTYLILFVLTPFLIGLIYLISNPDIILNGYSKREFNITQRVFTEFRVIWFYLFQTLLPNIKTMGLFHDDIEISKSIIDPYATIFSLIGLILILVISFLSIKKSPLVSFGLMFFILAHSLESTVIPLELVHEHRNYLPSIGVLIVIFNFLLTGSNKKVGIKLRGLMVALILLIFPIITMSRATDWSNAQRLWDAETLHHPNSTRALISYGNYYSSILIIDERKRDIYYEIANDAYLKTLEIDRNNIYALFGLIKLANIYNRDLDLSYVDRLRVSLSTSILPADTNNNFIWMARCLSGDNCKITNVQLEILIEAALANSKLQGRERALIYSAQMYYWVTVTQDYPRALRAVKKAIELDGDIENQMWLANIYIAMHDISAARNQILLIRGLDKLQSKDSDLKELEAVLASISK